MIIWRRVKIMQVVKLTNTAIAITPMNIIINSFMIRLLLLFVYFQKIDKPHHGNCIAKLTATIIYTFAWRKSLIKMNRVIKLPTDEIITWLRAHSLVNSNKTSFLNKRKRIKLFYSTFISRIYYWLQFEIPDAIYTYLRLSIRF